MNTTEQFQPAHPRLIAVDSDGCVLDSMEVKQRRCFIPATIEAWGLDEVQDAVWEVAAFVNLYSRWRGANRFVALAKTFELLSCRREVRERGVRLADMSVLRQWLAEESAPSNHTLEKESHSHGQDARATLGRVLEWSREVDRRVERVAGDVLPFPSAVACLARLAAEADVVVVSASTTETLAGEWSRTGLARHARWIAGQEVGGKAELLRSLAGRYAPGRAMMVGDAPGDLAAARGAGMLFWPIFPGDEEASWRRFAAEGLVRFREGTFAGEYEVAVVGDFLDRLPETPVSV